MQYNWFNIKLESFSDLVIASAGEDKKISLWHKNGQSMGAIPVAGGDSGDNIEVISYHWIISHKIWAALIWKSNCGYTRFY